MAGESPASAAIRRFARARPDLRHALFGDDSRLPVVFQYNPLIHCLEVNSQREVICTICRLDVLAPGIRYNVHDEGGTRLRRHDGHAAVLWTGSGELRPDIVPKAMAGSIGQGWHLSGRAERCSCLNAGPRAAPTSASNKLGQVNIRWRPCLTL
jgi:hypothetical protein